MGFFYGPIQSLFRSKLNQLPRLYYKQVLVWAIDWMLDTVIGFCFFSIPQILFG